MADQGAGEGAGATGRGLAMAAVAHLAAVVLLGTHKQHATPQMVVPEEGGVMEAAPGVAVGVATEVVLATGGLAVGSVEVASVEASKGEVETA